MHDIRTGDIQKQDPDLKVRVMSRIKAKKVKMRSHAVFLAEKLGFESALLASILVGALFLSLILYLFKKAGLFRFLSLGFPGLKVVLYSLPYGYFILFIAAGILVVYFSQKLDIPCQKNISCDRIFIYFIGLGAIMGIIFFLLGIHRIFGELAEQNIIPMDMAARGRIIRVGPDRIIIEDEKGNITDLILETEDLFPGKRNYVEGKFLQAIGRREKEKEYFHAQAVFCCDDN